MQNQTMQIGLLLDNGARKKGLLTDKTHIHQRSTSVRTYIVFTMGVP
jgi:hypothetical protein